MNSVLDRLFVTDFELLLTLPRMKPLVIKKGTRHVGIWTSSWSQYLAKPEKFNPERFFGEQKKHSFNCGAYLPIGLDSRIYISNRFASLETKIVLFHLLALCELEICEKPPLQLKIAKDDFNMASEGFWLNLMKTKMRITLLQLIMRNAQRKKTPFLFNCILKIWR